MTRQQQRRRERDLKKVGAGILRRGLPDGPDRVSITGLAALMRAKLAETNNLRRASEAAALLHAAYDASEAKLASEVAVACAKGCNYCCHTYVSVLAPEVFRLAGQIREKPDAASAVSAITGRAGQSANKAPDERHGKQIPCPLLTGGLCSVYASRPILCRKTASTSVEACRAVFEGGRAGWSMPLSNDVFSRAALFALSVALQACKLSWHSYELSAAVCVALARPDGEAAWLSGEDVFSAVRRDARPPDFERRVEREAASLLADA